MNRIVLNKDKFPYISNIFNALFNKKVLGIIITIVTYIVVFSLIYFSISPKQFDLKVGDITDEPIKAPRDVEDKILTKQKMDKARENVSDIYRLDQRITNNVTKDTNMLIEDIEKIRNRVEEKINFLENQERLRLEQSQAAVQAAADTQKNDNNVTKNEKTPADDKNAADKKPKERKDYLNELLDDKFLNELRGMAHIKLSKDDIILCATVDHNELEILYTGLQRAIENVLDFGIKKENLFEARSTVRENIESLPISNEFKVLGNMIASSVIQPNMLYDDNATQAEKDKEAQNVEKVIYKKGQYIVQAGQPVTENQIQILKELGILKNQHVDLPLVIGIAMIVFIILFIMALYFVAFQKDIIDQPKLLLMISIIICLDMVLSLSISRLNIYMIPYAMAGMLLAILLNPYAAFAANIGLAFLLGIMLEGHLGVMINALLSGALGIIMAARSRQRNSIIWAGLGVGVLSFFIACGMELISIGNWSSALTNGLWGIGGGLLAAVLTIGTLPIWENIFKIVTPLKLIELLDPNQPVLKRLLMEAPGTYHHSIIVANLAESAAEAIDANGLLARVGAYYHDIGKLKRPYFFKENQLSADNPHDKIDPILSTRIITMHTSDGIDIAKQYNIPNIIQDFILQHHGTTPVIYFYHKAKTNAENIRIELDDFRYSGPKPQSRESAIVMMADMVEAAVRSLNDPTPKNIDDLIRKLINTRLEDGQLDECSITLKDLETIAKTFGGVICGIFHERVKYPDVDINQERRKQINDIGNR